MGKRRSDVRIVVSAERMHGIVSAWVFYARVRPIDGVYGDEVASHAGTIYTRHLSVSLRVYAPTSHEAQRAWHGDPELAYEQPCGRAIVAYEARAMTKTFAAIERALARAAEKYGAPSSYDENVRRIATVLGAESVEVSCDVLRLAKRNPDHYPLTDRNTYATNAEESIAIVRQAVANAVRELSPEERTG